MSINSPGDLEKLRAVGRVVGETLRVTASRVRPGITTAELDGLADAMLKRQGARSAPRLVYHFPGSLCISVNEEAVHGIPGARVIREGDMVKLDLTAELDGYMADAAVTVVVPPAPEPRFLLARCAEVAFHDAMRVARAGNSVRDIGRAVERSVTSRGFAVMRELSGHGIGRTIHEPPSVPNYSDPRSREPLLEGLVLAVEPIVAAGIGRGVLEADGWTIRTVDRGLVAHFEHTIVITKGSPILLTAA
jgi:methionyl aminopeptidase